MLARFRVAARRLQGLSLAIVRLYEERIRILVTRRLSQLVQRRIPVGFRQRRTALLIHGLRRLVRRVAVIAQRLKGRLRLGIPLLLQQTGRVQISTGLQLLFAVPIAVQRREQRRCTLAVAASQQQLTPLIIGLLRLCGAIFIITQCPEGLRRLGQALLRALHQLLLRPLIAAAKHIILRVRIGAHIRKGRLRLGILPLLERGHRAAIPQIRHAMEDHAVSRARRHNANHHDLHRLTALLLLQIVLLLPFQL